VDYRASCVFSGPFSWQYEKEKENQRDAIFFEKITFFFNPYIGIPDFLPRMYSPFLSPTKNRNRELFLPLVLLNE